MHLQLRYLFATAIILRLYLPRYTILFADELCYIADATAARSLSCEDYDYSKFHDGDAGLYATPHDTAFRQTRRHSRFAMFRYCRRLLGASSHTRMALFRHKLLLANWHALLTENTQISPQMLGDVSHWQYYRLPIAISKYRCL